MKGKFSRNMSEIGYLCNVRGQYRGKSMFTIITIVFFTILLVLIWEMVLKIVKVLRGYLLIFVSMPVMPFIVAYKNRNTRPIISRLLVVLWTLLYVISGIIFFLF